MMKEPSSHAAPPRQQSVLLLVLAVFFVALIGRPDVGSAAVEGRACETEPTDETIQYGELITCEITPIGEPDLFRSQGTIGHTIVVSTARHSGGVDPCINLYAPSGALERSACGFGSASNSITTALLETGTYTIEIFDGNSDETGTYAVHLDRVSPTSPAALPINYGTLLIDEINPVADLDLFRFQGTSGHTIVVNTARHGGGVDPCINLYAPDGVLERSACGFGSASNSITATLLKTGTYTVMIFDGNSDETGIYAVHLDRVSPTSPAALPIDYGTLLTGEISPVADLDLYWFQGTSGHTIVVNTARNSDGVDPCINLYDPDGVLEASACGFGSPTNSITTTLLKTGAYTIMIFDGNSDETGTYALNLDRVSPPSSSTLPIDYGTLLTGEIIPVADLDLYGFQGTSGHTIVVNTARNGGGVDPCINLYDSDGVLERSACGFGSASNSITTTLLKTGAYTIMIFDGNSDETGTYALHLDRVSPTSPAAISINYGTLLIDEISPVADLDLFWFHGTSGHTIVVNTARNGGGVDPCINLYDPDGVLERSACGFGSASNSITATLLKTGAYAIMIFDGNSDEAGTYALHLDRVSPHSPAAIPLDYGALVEGEIAPVGDLDLFVIGGIADSTIQISTSRLTGGVDPCINLYDPDGVLERSACGFGSATNSITTTLLKTGNYAVMLYDGNSDEPGTFSLSLQCIAGPPCPPPDVLRITSGPNGSPNPVASGGVSTLEVAANDSLGHPLTYAWTASCPGLPADGSFSDASAQNPTWSAPQNGTAIQENCTIRVTVSDGEGQSQEGSYGQVVLGVGGTTVISPDGGDIWGIGSTHNITWTSNPPGASVKIEVSRNGIAGPWSTIIANTADDGTYSWLVNGPRSTKARIRVSGSSGSDVSDDFTIGGSITIISPNGIDTCWPIGSAQNITWTSTALAGGIKIELSRNGGGAWSTIIGNTPNDGTHSWVVTGPATSQGRIRVTSVTDPLATDTKSVKIGGCASITVTSPNGGETWAIGSTQSITWTTSGPLTGNVKIELSRTGGTSPWSTIIGNTPNDGTHSWLVTGPHSTQARIRVTSLTDTTVADTSDANFTIGGSIAVTFPNGGETWPIGSTQNITWTSNALTGNVKIELSRNGGLTWPTTISPNTPNDGTHSWVVTGPATTQARIRVTSLTDSIATDSSDANFTIGGGSITLNSPNGGETWAIGSTQNITWTSTGLIGNVKIEVSRNGGTAWTVIVASTPNDGTHPWVVPGPASTQVRIRVCSVTDTTVCDSSSANFAIGGGSLTVTAPNGGETWPIGSTQNITWTSTGLIGNVKIEVSRNGGTSWTAIIASTPNDGTHPWIVTGPASTQARIRLCSVTDTMVCDASNGNFTIP